MLTASFIQVNIRGLFNGQQFQISPTYTITDVDGADPAAGNFNFIDSSISAWLVAWWNGWGALPTNGVSDVLAALLPETALVNEVFCVARSALMELPVQASIFGELNGTRDGSLDAQTSNTAVSCRAKSTVWGRKGASFRGPFLTKGDTVGNDITESARTLIQTGILDKLTVQGTEAALEVGLTVNVGAGEILNVFAMEPAAVARVPNLISGKPEFPYVGPGRLSAVTCEPWTLNPYVGSQNSRKVGRGK